MVCGHNSVYNAFRASDYSRLTQEDISATVACATDALLDEFTLRPLAALTLSNLVRDALRMNQLT